VSGEEELENYEVDQELRLYREYRDVLPMFTYVVETERRFYLANSVELRRYGDDWIEVEMTDAWVWDMHRPARFVSRVRVVTAHDVNIEELKSEEPGSEPPPLTGT
jgi:hypothetical protein